MLFEYTLKADRQHFYNITPQVREAVSKSGTASGLCVVYCPHTTAGITINENAGPNVIHDMLLGTWQGLYFCEFDPPRNRKFYVKVVGL